MEQGGPPASVVIRNRNERPHLEPLLRALSLQTVRPEVVVVDNESTDGSAEMAAASGAKLVHLAKSEFTYGRAINVGVANASAEIIVMLSAHSLPLGKRFIEDCLEPFTDERVAAVRCLRMEVASEWLNPLTLDAPVPVDRSWVWPENNGCAFRKSVWRQIPFDEQIEFAEDRLWSYQVLQAGYRIATAHAWYQYFKTERFWASLGRYRRQEIAFYRLTGRKVPIPAYLREVLVRAPQKAIRMAVHMGLQTVLGATIAAMAPWYARRPPRAGSVR
ncbi:MAG: glycosyltransferase family 2 protein [Acidobacteriia bacterium]|nr:glycosyltransferase family 2 protein [Terriglobia bacterium]